MNPKTWVPRRRWLRWLLGVLGAVVLTIAVLALVRAYLLFPQVALEPILRDEPLEMPTHLAEFPDGSGEMAVTEKAGRILRFHRDAPRAAGVLLDLRARVAIEGWEDGLFSIAFHPRFRENGKFFVFYTAAEPRRVVISRFTMDRDTRTADPAGEETILTIGKPSPNHNGGSLVFAPDGTLFLGVGDSQVARHGQQRDTLLGKVLRIDVDRPGDGRAYGIPPDNPFAGGRDGFRPEIWAYGFRNPWRISLDRETGEMYAGDVGSTRFEEVDRVVKGGNYGWAHMEGEACSDLLPNCNPADFRFPLAAFPRYVTRAIIGGHVYRGEQLPWLRGKYVFGTYFRGLYAIPIDDSGVITLPEVLLYRPRADHGANEGKEIRISSLAEDLSGELYVVDLKGGLYRIVER
ncbi:MAG: PQQ-dependent sugar dehydrogenase [SAR324 cluster bacterium]|nr:PQQ-dependent sugar dehydrogenase [SAR324 cluster bacterium]